MSVQSCPSYDRAEFAEAQGSAAHEMSIEERNADTIWKWRQSDHRESANAHLGLRRNDSDSLQIQINPKLSFITWAKKHGILISPYRNTMYKKRYGVSYTAYFVGTDVQCLAITDTFHGAMQAACTAIFGKL